MEKNNMFMILFVLHDPAKLDQIITVWEGTGTKGITILPSTGMVRRRNKGDWQDDVPMFPSIQDFKEHTETLNRTLITIVNSDEMVEKIVAATESIIGDLDLPNTGILTVLPVVKTYGLGRKD